MQVHEFRRELQDAILRLQRIAQKIDDDHLNEVAQNEIDAAHNRAVAQARREIEAGVSHPDVVPVVETPVNRHVELIDDDDDELNAEQEVSREKQRKAIEARQLEARQAAAKTKEK